MDFTVSVPAADIGGQTLLFGGKVITAHDLNAR
jgi:hypothetical protein